MKKIIIGIFLLAALPAAAETFNIEVDYMVDTTPGSALVLFPGTFDEVGNGSIVYDQPVRLYSATSSVIK